MKKRKYVILGVMAAFSLTGCSTPDTSQTLPERLNEIWQSQQSQAETGATQQSQIEEIQTQDAPQEGTIAQPVPPNKKQLHRHRPHSKLQQQSLTTILHR